MTHYLTSYHCECCLSAKYISLKSNFINFEKLAHNQMEIFKNWIICFKPAFSPINLANMEMLWNSTSLHLNACKWYHCTYSVLGDLQYAALHYDLQNSIIDIYYSFSSVTLGDTIQSLSTFIFKQRNSSWLS